VIDGDSTSEAVNTEYTYDALDQLLWVVQGCATWM
jgi:hypothetical protein